MGSGVTPASFSPSDLHPSLTGDQSELKQLWDSKGSPMREDFDFSDFDDFLASLALPPMTGDGEDRPPLIGLRVWSQLFYEGNSSFIRWSSQLP